MFVTVGSGIITANEVDAASSINNANKPNGTNHFATILDLNLILELISSLEDELIDLTSKLSLRIDKLENKTDHIDETVSEAVNTAIEPIS